MANNYFEKIIKTLDFINIDEILNVCRLIESCKHNIFIFGNGGSAATASHIAQDMSKMLGYKFICLNDNIPSILAYGNDIGFNTIFKLQLANLISSGDLVMGISCSGNSPNVIEAIIYAKHFGYMTIGFTGFDGGQLGKIVEHNIYVPCNDMQVCEDIHLMIGHYIMKVLSNGYRCL